MTFWGKPRGLALLHESRDVGSKSSETLIRDAENPGERNRSVRRESQVLASQKTPTAPGALTHDPRVLPCIVPPARESCSVAVACPFTDQQAPGEQPSGRIRFRSVCDRHQWDSESATAE